MYYYTLVHLGSVLAGVQGARHGVLVSLIGVVLWAPDVVPEVGVAVVVAVARIVPRHVDEVGGGVAAAANVAHINRVAEPLVHQLGLHTQKVKKK